jgi:hypothetical protein
MSANCTNCIVYTSIVSNNWFDYETTKTLTKDEIDNVYNPYINFLQSLEGYQYSNTTNNISENVIIVTHQFNSFANANVALYQIIGPRKNVVIINRTKLLNLKLEQYNANNPSAPVTFNATITVQ